MVPNRSLQPLGRICKRYGPGRLPRAEQRDLGAGYAAASGAFALAVAYAIANFALSTLGVQSDFVDPFWGYSALLAIPIVVPSAFVAATLVWRSLPQRVPWFGVVAGGLATALTYVFSLALTFVVALPLAMTDHGAAGGTLAAATWLTVFVAFFAFFLTTWLTIPMGCLCGSIYERTRAVSRPTD